MRFVGSLQLEGNLDLSPFFILSNTSLLVFTIQNKSLFEIILEDIIANEYTFASNGYNFVDSNLFLNTSGAMYFMVP
uniref:Uncharacterized protein n=1 Tax=Physcomitrium patens TaxID=3218 RepID=A0A2K1K4I9_PHYPA|nr:hypothetical protein PHYPA_013161 [Physcomitrium patens]